MDPADAATFKAAFDATALLGKVFGRQNYRSLARALKDRDAVAIRRFIQHIADDTFETDIIKGVAEIVNLASQRRGMRTLVNESDEFQLGRLFEFCTLCVQGQASELQDLDVLPVWLQ